jgi:hypothetical protein
MITAICDEMFTRFPDPLSITMNNILAGDHPNNCPHCKSENSLRPAKDFELQNLGLTAKDYE